MSKKNLLMLSVSVMFGAALVVPSAALAQFGPPPGPPQTLAGPPPDFGAGGRPPGLSAGGPRLGGAPGAPPRDIAGAPPHFWRLGGATALRGRAAAYSANYTRNGYAGYGYGHGHGYRYWPYAAAAAYAHGGSYASSDDGCYYVSAHRRNGYRRVLVCLGS
jgi:hypothetical protein